MTAFGHRNDMVYFQKQIRFSICYTNSIRFCIIDFFINMFCKPIVLRMFFKLVITEKLT